jgi:hypothetical protein
MYGHRCAAGYLSLLRGKAFIVKSAVDMGEVMARVNARPADKLARGAVMKTIIVPSYHPAPSARRFAGSEVKLSLSTVDGSVAKMKTVEVQMSGAHARSLRDALSKLLSEIEGVPT